ncbi:unnamed protein product, partial [Ixodes persulcatus]
GLRPVIISTPAPGYTTLEISHPATSVQCGPATGHPNTTELLLAYVKLVSTQWLVCLACLILLAFLFHRALCPLRSAAMSLTCCACLKPISPDGRLMTCSTCAQNYHPGKVCSGIADSTFATLNLEKKEKWRCRACRSKGNNSTLDGANESSGVFSQSDSPTLTGQIFDINRKLDSLLSLKTSVDLLMELPGKVNELLLLKPSIELMKASVEEVQTSIAFLAQKYDSLLEATSVHEKEIKGIHSEMEGLRVTVSEQANTIQALQSEINETEQQSRLSTMEIQGMQVATGEALAPILVGLADKLGLKGHLPSDVLSTQRIPAKRDQNPIILVKFASVSIKDRWMQARGKLRLLANEGTPGKVYFNENLTPSNRELFWLARSRGRERGYKFVWVKNGRIFARKEEGAPPVRISRKRDLDLIT